MEDSGGTEVINLDYALVGKSLEWKEYLNVEVVDGVITHVGNGHVGNAIKLPGLLLPSLVNFHAHAGDYMIMEGGWSLNIREAVGDPHSYKYQAFNSGYDVMASIKSFLRESLRFGVKTVVDFREQGIQGSRLASSLKGDPDLREVNYFIMGRLDDQVTVDALRELLRYADGYGLPSPSVKYDVTVIRDSVPLRASHFAETLSQWLRDDLEEFIRDFSPSFLVHGTWLSEDEMRLLSEHHIPLAVCPRSNAWFSVGLPKVDLAIDMGVDLFLGTDNGAWVNPNLWRDMELALLLSRTRKPGSDYSKEILEGSTVKSASFLGLRNSVEEGTPLRMVNLVDAENSGISVSKNKYTAIIKRAGDYLVTPQEQSI